MRRPLDLPPDQILYRQLTPASWDQRKNRLNSNVFRRRPNEQGVSVYRADLQTPQGVLQACIDAQHRKLASGDPEQIAAAENFVRLYGTTVESLVDAGWCIARVPVSAFTERGFTLTEARCDRPPQRVRQCGRVCQIHQRTEQMRRVALPSTMPGRVNALIQRRTPRLSRA